MKDTYRDNAGDSSSALSRPSPASPYPASRKRSCRIWTKPSQSLITNALKYAFDGTEAGRLEVGLKQESGTLRMRVSDNGPGFPENFDWKKSESFGFRLLQSFSQKLKGEIFTGNGPGAWVELRIHAFQGA